MSQRNAKKTGRMTRYLNGIARIGNSLPHPVTLFDCLPGTDSVPGAIYDLL